VREKLSAKAFEPLAPGGGCRWVLEIDGVRVLGRAHEGECEGMEIKTAVKADDELVGISDGAVWIERLFECLGATQVIDVYHACEYLEEVMLAMDYDERRRARVRQSWCRGLPTCSRW
jgi:hypothetical protein